MFTVGFLVLNSCSNFHQVMNESFLPLVGEKQTKFEHEIDKMEVTCFVLESSDFTKYVIYLSHQLKDSLLKKNLFSICSALWKTCAIFTS